MSTTLPLFSPLVLIFIVRVPSLNQYRLVLLPAVDVSCGVMTKVNVTSTVKIALLNTLQVMDQVRSGEVRLLVATDVAARGLDVKDIAYVVNYDFPVDGVEVLLTTVVICLSISK